MIKGLFVSLVFLLAGAGLVLGQVPETLPVPPAVNAIPSSPGDLTPVPPLDILPAPGVILNGLLPETSAPSSIPGAGKYIRPAPSYFQLDTDYTLWYFPLQRHSSHLATTGVLGFPATTLAAEFGDKVMSRRSLQGGTFSLGYWEAVENPWVPGGIIPTLGLETRFYFTGQRSVATSVERAPFLVRPFFDLNNNRESGVLIAATDPTTSTPLASGGIVASAKGSFWGSEANVWRNVYYDTPGTQCSLDVMAGFRYLNLNSALEISTNSLFYPGIATLPGYAFLANNRLVENESFVTHNNFYGGQLGVAGHLYLERITVTGTFKLGLGSTHEAVKSNGSQVRIAPDGTATTSLGALLALPSNIGHHNQNRFTPLPEVGLDISIPILNCLTFSLGFHALYWSKAVLAGEQIDRAIDITQIPNFPGAAGAVPTGLNRPAVPFEQSHLWILATTVGAEFKW